MEVYGTQTSKQKSLACEDRGAGKEQPVLKEPNWSHVMEANRGGEFGTMSKWNSNDQVRCRPKPRGNEHAICDFIDITFSCGDETPSTEKQREGERQKERRPKRGLAKSWMCFSKEFH